MTDHDVIIIGSGPAGYTAAIYTARAGLRPVVFAGAITAGGALMNTTEVENFPGFPEGIMGPDLMQQMQAQAERFGAEVRFQDVTAVDLTGDVKSVTTDDDEVLTARSVILALGSEYKKLGIDSEARFCGRGVSYCATCDGMFYKDGELIVIGAHEEAVEEANYLATLARVTYVKEKPHETGGLAEGITVLPDKPLKLYEKGEKLALETDQGELVADGVFILRPAVAMTQLSPEVAAENGDNIVEKNLATSVPGVFAAGDLLGAPLQAAKAVGEGNVAALSVASYLLKRAPK